MLSDKSSASISKVELEAQGAISGKLDPRFGGLAVDWKTGADTGPAFRHASIFGFDDVSADVKIKVEPAVQKREDGLE